MVCTRGGYDLREVSLTEIADLRAAKCLAWAYEKLLVYNVHSGSRSIPVQEVLRPHASHGHTTKQYQSHSGLREMAA